MYYFLEAYCELIYSIASVSIAICFLDFLAIKILCQFLPLAESLLLAAETRQNTELGADLVEFVLDNFYVIVDALESSDVSFWN